MVLTKVLAFHPELNIIHGNLKEHTCIYLLQKSVICFHLSDRLATVLLKWQLDSHKKHFFLFSLTIEKQNFFSFDMINWLVSCIIYVLISALI